MGLLTAIRARRYRVTVLGIGEFPVERFRTLGDARVYADYLAETTGALCFIHFEQDRQTSRLVYRTDGPDDDDSPGVREPRRPRPHSSAGAIALELPE
jgi:hypothetical protein